MTTRQKDGQLMSEDGRCELSRSKGEFICNACKTRWLKLHQNSIFMFELHMHLISYLSVFSKVFWSLARICQYVVLEGWLLCK